MSERLSVSKTKPAGGGCVPTRVVLHRGNEVTPFIVHFEVLRGDTWSYHDGGYYQTLADAGRDYSKRCHVLGVAEC